MLIAVSAHIRIEHTDASYAGIIHSAAFMFSPEQLARYAGASVSQPPNLGFRSLALPAPTNKLCTSRLFLSVLFSDTFSLCLSLFLLEISLIINFLNQTVSFSIATAFLREIAESRAII